MYYIFDKTGKCVCSTMQPITYGDTYTTIETDKAYDIVFISLVDGEIVVKKNEPSEEDTVIVENEPKDVTMSQVQILELISEICEDVDALKKARK